MAPVKDYFSGHGIEVMRKMKKKYGKRAKEVFYATANKRKQKVMDNLSASR